MGQIEQSYAHRDQELADTLKNLLERGPIEWEGIASTSQVLRSKTPRLVHEVSPDLLRAAARVDEHRRLLGAWNPVTHRGSADRAAEKRSAP